MEYLQWAPCVLLGLLSATLIALSWLSFVGWWFVGRRRGEGHSWCFPCAWGILGAIACMACPRDGLWQYAWIPLLLDPSIGLALVVVSAQAVARFVRPSRSAGPCEDRTEAQVPHDG